MPPVLRRKPSVPTSKVVSVTVAAPKRRNGGGVVDKEALAAKLRASLPTSMLAEDGASESLITIKRYHDKIRNPLTAIRAKCVECSGGSLREVSECRVKECALWSMRMGVNPFHKRTKSVDLGLGPDDTGAGEEE